MTAEDIQRTRPPLVTMVCEECRDKFRSVARLETSYSTGMATRDLALTVLVGFSLLLLWTSLAAGLHVSLALGTVSAIVLLPAVVLFSGLRMAYAALADRYGFTHDLAWSLHSRSAMIGLALILSSILAMIFHAFLY